MDWETYKTNSSESFEVDRNTGFVKMHVIRDHWFKVGSMISFHHTGLHLVLQITFPLSANESPAPSQKSSRGFPFSLYLFPHTCGVCRVSPRSSKVMEGKPEVTPVTPGHLYMEIQGKSSQKALCRRK